MRFLLKPDDTTEKVAMVLVIVALFILAAMMCGCESTPCKCPKIQPPKTVTKVIYKTAPLPVPDPPVLTLPTVDRTDTTAVLLAISHDFSELVRAWLEASGIIDAHNIEAKQ